MKNQDELFAVEREDGEWLNTGQDDFSVYTSLAEAEDARDADENKTTCIIVRFVRESASASPAPPSCSACGGDTAMRLVCTTCYSVVGGFEKSPLSEADLARIAVRHFPVLMPADRDENEGNRMRCLAALREACGMGGKA